MNKNLRALIAAGLLAATPLMASGAFAQEMSESLGMLETAVTRAFGQLGIEDVTMGNLTLSQLGTIKNVIESSDYNDGEKKAQIMKIVGEGS